MAKINFFFTRDLSKFYIVYSRRSFMFFLKLVPILLSIRIDFFSYIDVKYIVIIGICLLHRCTYGNTCMIEIIGVRC